MAKSKFEKEANEAVKRVSDSIGAHSIPKTELFLVDYFENESCRLPKSFEFTDKETKEKSIVSTTDALEEFLAFTGQSKEEFLETALIGAMRKELTKTRTNQSKTKKERLASGSSSAYQKTDEFCKKIMKQNEKANKPEDKIFLSYSYILTTLKTSRKPIKNWLEHNEELLNEHNKKNGLTKGHNERMGRLKKSQEIKRILNKG